MLGWMKHKLESRLPGEISITSDMQMMPHLRQKVKRKVKEESEKAGLKLNIQKIRSWHLVPSLHVKWMGRQWKQWQTLFSWAPKSLQMVTAAMKLKDTCSLEEKLMTNLHSILQSRDITVPTKVHLFKAMAVVFSSSHVCMWELDHKDSWTPKNWCFWTGVF